MLHLQDITFRLGPRLLFDKASAALPASSRVGFTGRNGAGKTTLFRLVAGEITAENGVISLPRSVRIGRVEQEAPGGPQKLVDFVLEADLERAALMAEAETAMDPERISDIQMRLIDIDAHAAPSRAASILSGLGFDHEAQNRTLSEFSGGWRMRVALAAVLFSGPDLLLLDEPTNYLDLEGTLWLMNYLVTCPATLLIISHDRDLLDGVCDHILHLDSAKLTLWKGNYSSFEKQRREAQAILLKHKKKQDDQRKHLQAFVDRFRAKASKATQAQSRLKILAKMEPVAAMTDSTVLPFHLPSPAKPLAPPLVVMEDAATGYQDRTVLSHLNLTLSDDDRIGLLGSNGNGKSTFAKLISGRLAPTHGVVRNSSRMEAGFFAQHQVDDLDANSTPYRAIADLMPGHTEAKIRARCAQMGFANVKADTRIELLSGGEKARLLMGLASFNGPHLLILDEPTNHLDIDSRAALIEALNDYQGAVIIVSHDRYLLEACADRLWLVANGTVTNFDGDMDDYRRYVLEQSGALTPSRKEKKARERAALAEAQAQAALAAQQSASTMQAIGSARNGKKIAEAEEKVGKLNALISRVDQALANPQLFQRDPARGAELTRQRADLEKALQVAEEAWLALSEGVG